MSKTILTEVNGWTPVIDGIVRELGIISAVVFGKAWRYCQMSDKVCKASQDRLATELGLSRATVNIHLSKLTEAGYLEDTTPNLIGLPHIYKDTGKANLSILFTATCQDNLQPPVKQIDTKIVLKERIKKVKTSAKEHAPTPPEIALYRAVTKRYPKKDVYDVVISAIQAVSLRLNRDCSVSDLEPYFMAWLTKSNNEYNFSVWLLEWAVNGSMQQTKIQNKNSGADALMQYAQNIGAV